MIVPLQCNFRYNTPGPDFVSSPVDTIAADDKRPLRDTCAQSSENRKYQFTTPQKTQAITAWKNQLSILNNTVLAQVTVQVQEQLTAKTILTDSSLTSRKMGGTYRVRQGDELLQVPSELLELEIIHQSYCI